ncbi:MAG: hypothetical protein A3D31_00950 [Candidatus Fluviicola riflensis]|nr:MAG: hypothetical protein A3D31_00950 [Candidatus Fluviicola riflensis]OGS83283.1 MAG: hypothetical protein A2724_00890 [Fluviicola sp. RIFCSPHIGHO2_01_FULL_43_53]OGS83705.1 MAG: hypothetical protein A3E30_17555 [Fluviicola sp. RIFCSPHIGHO2_12_FULL_43_24]
MNTTLKGNQLEKRLYLLLSDLLNNDLYYLNRKNSHVFEKKGYYSVARESEIVFDVTIESYLPGVSDFSILHVFECKNLAKNVTVDDIEEFSSKLDQVGKHNTKGIMVSTKGFGSGTKRFAKNLKIALLLIKSNNDLEWINYRKNNKKLTINIEKEHSEPFLAYSNGKTINNVADLLLEEKIIDFYSHKDKYLEVPFKSHEDLERIISKMYTYDIHDDFCINTEKLCSFIKKYYNASFDFETHLADVLGKIEFDPLKISINPDLKDSRFRFTLCHEIGHLILHGKLLKEKIDKREDLESSLSMEYNVSDKNTMRMEIQANQFANHLLIPLNNFKHQVQLYFKENNINRPRLYLDEQKINQQLARNLMDRLSLKYNVSLQSIKIRLVQIELLEDKTDYSIKKILKNMQF